MKLFYLNFIFEKEKGVRRKIDFQKKALENNNVFVDISKINNRKFYIGKKIIGNINDGSNLKDKICRKVNFYFLLKKLKNRELYSEYDLVYIRYIQSSFSFLSYLRFLKSLGKKIIIEIPTYPYDGEMKNNIFTILDKTYRVKLYKYIDKIVTYSKETEIWGIPCINISNGIDLNKVKLVKKKEKNQRIVFTSISTCFFWHGIDRMLNSIVDYKKKCGDKELIFNIVGDGAETVRLKEIVKNNLILKDSVIFHGFKLGEELDEIYNNTDIAVGSLGIHRIKGLKEVQPLKNREYCAKGLPFIISFKDPDFIGKDFVYSDISNDDNNFDIEKIIKWYENLKTTPEEMREYSKQFSWDIQMKKVIDNI